jgi:hypothetical protein
MTHPEFGKISLVSTPCLEVGSLHNLRLLIDSAILSFPGRVKSKKRRDNGQTTSTSITDHLGGYTIPYINSGGDPKETD